MLQFEFKVKVGLTSSRYFLYLGCGSVQNGIYSTQYLENGHCFGIGSNEDMLFAGHDFELPENGLVYKIPVAAELLSFEFQMANVAFDFAPSVFTRLHVNKIIRCITTTQRVLALVRQFSGNTQGNRTVEPISHPCSDGPEDQNTSHYAFKDFQWICQSIDLTADYLPGDCGYRQDQNSGVLTKVQSWRL
jgi:hypothetical protein